MPELDIAFAEITRFMKITRRRLENLESQEYPPGGIGPFLLLPELRGFWPMSGMDADYNVQDMSLNGNLAENIDGVEFGLTSKFLPYSIFDGGLPGSYFKIAHSASISDFDELTFGCFVYMNTVPSNHPDDRGVIGKQGMGVRGWGMSISHANTHCGFSENGSNNFFIHNTGNTLLPNTWYFLVCRISKPNTTMVIDLFINGVLVATSDTTAVSIYQNTEDVIIGAYPTFSSGDIQTLDGYIALPFVSASALPNILISSLYSNIKPLL